MKNKSFIITILAILIVSLFSTNIVCALTTQNHDLQLSLNQKDYYFKTGENAIIELNSNNTYNQDIKGLLTYSITQTINQNNMHYSSSNTQSMTLDIQKNKSILPLNFGTSDKPTTLSVNLNYKYTMNDSRVVSLNDIKIYFVDNESKKKNTQNQMKSSSKQTQSSQKQNNQQSTAQQKMQKMMNQLNNNQQKQTPKTQQKLQNNQMNQDSSALKKEMEKKVQKQNQMKNEFQKNLNKNSNFKKMQKDLLNQGYNISNTNLNPKSNNTGNFNINYTNKNGQKASLKGQMQNGTLKNIQKDTPQIRKQLMNQLEQNKEFQKYKKQLQNENYQKQNTQFTQNTNNTNIKINYQNNISKNNTATITAEIVNNTIKKITLNKNTKKNNNYVWWIVLIIGSIVGYYIYVKTKKKNSKNIKVEKPKEKIFDYKKEALKLIDDSKELFKKKLYKDAYGNASQALRLYLSYDNNLNKEITSYELLRYLKKNTHKIKDNDKKNYLSAKDFKIIQECFNLCSLVEFAKYQANKKDFDKIINDALKIIK